MPSRLLKKTSDPALGKLAKYDRIAVYLFRRLAQNHTADTLPHEIPFKRGDIDAAMDEAVADGIVDKIANVPDIKYTYDARKNLPDEIEQLWPVTWLQAGKGRYKLRKTKRMNIIRLNDWPNVKTEFVPDNTPPFISELLGKDEQANFTRVRYNGLIGNVLGFQAWPLQGHHRTTVSYGQIEVDEVYAGIDGQQGIIVPISGKGGQDKLSWSQALNLNTYGVEKAPVDGLAVRSIGMWTDAEGAVWIVEFTPHLAIDEIEIVKVRRFVFKKHMFGKKPLAPGSAG